jgi:thiol:disulfide interchange protein DsbD
MSIWRVLAIAAIAVLSAGAPTRAQGFTGPQLKVESVASVDRIRPGDSFQIAIILSLPPGLHVNAHLPSDPDLIPTVVEITPPPGIEVGAVEYPAARERALSFTPKPIAVYEGEVVMLAPATASANLARAPLVLEGTLTAQACNDESCFPPSTVPFSLKLAVDVAGAAVKPVRPELFAAGATMGPGEEGTPQSGAIAAAGSRAHYSRLTKFVPPDEFVRWLEEGAPAEEKSRLSDLILGGHWLLALPLIYLAGLALNLTPCVYPLIPITIGFFGGQSGGSRRHLLSLASLYVLGMALMYSTLGVVAAMNRQLFGNQLQNPYVLLGFAAVMIALGLSMFGVWEFRVPAGLAGRVSGRAGFAGALFMGLLVGFVAAPCIGPVVVALLAVVSQLGHPGMGFGIFFALALGLGTPYLLLGVFSGLIQRLPRSGEWMNAVKHIFGLILFGMAVYYLAPLLDRPISGTLMGLYTLGAGVYLLFFDSAGRSLRGFFAAKRGLGALVAVAGVSLLIPRAQPAGIPFEAYSEERLQEALAEGRGVLIDFRAEWCTACRELETKTFRDPKVVAATRDLLPLKVDMTRWNAAQTQRLKEEYGIVGLPTVVLVPPASGQGE